jgi:NO-binding membrane sensor protein with MHYT domain
MSTLMSEYEQVQRRRRRFALLVVLACVAGVGVWLTLPLGIVVIGMGNQIGWGLLVVGLVLLAGMVVSIVAAARTRVVSPTSVGKPDPRFGEPEPSRNPVGGNGWIDSGIGSQ